MTPPTRLLTLFTFTLAGCTITPLTLDESHPASAHAPESLANARKPQLKSDKETRRTASLISDREKQNSGAPQAPAEARQPAKMDHDMSDMPEMDMSIHMKH